MVSASNTVKAIGPIGVFSVVAWGGNDSGQCAVPASASSALSVAAGDAHSLALLASGFPLRDRVLRISGLALLLFCILKLFVYDLSYLDTLPRIFSFIVLGLILVGVSWIYTRFRENVQRFL